MESSADELDDPNARTCCGAERRKSSPTRRHAGAELWIPRAGRRMDAMDARVKAVAPIRRQRQCLRCMRERFGEHGCDLRAKPGPKAGFCCTGRCPLRRRVAATKGWPMIRVLLVDDQTLVRQGVRSLLSLAEGIEVIGEASDGRQAVDVIPQLKPDVVLMDMRMPVMSGLEALQALARLGTLPPTIILTTFDDDQLVLAGLKAAPRLPAQGSLAGAGGRRIKTSRRRALAAAMTQRLLSGRSTCNDFVTSTARPVDRARDRDPRLMAWLPNKEIAIRWASRGRSRTTVEHHVQARRARSPRRCSRPSS